MQPVPARRRMVGGRLERHVMLLEWRPQETMEVAPADLLEGKASSDKLHLLTELFVCVCET